MRYLLRLLRRRYFDRFSSMGVARPICPNLKTTLSVSFFFLMVANGIVEGALSRPSELRLLTLVDGSALDFFIPALADANRMNRVFATVAKQTGLRFCPTRHVGKDITAASVRAFFKSTHGSRSIVVVYYSGSPKGCMYEPSGFISQRSVCKSMKRFRPRLGIVMFDCYSKINTKNKNLSSSYVEPSAITGDKAIGLCSLFLNYVGIVKITSDPCVDKCIGSYAQWPGPTGGVCSSSFLTALYRCAAQFQPTWKNVADTARRVHQENGLLQEDVFTLQCHRGTHKKSKKSRR